MKLTKQTIPAAVDWVPIKDPLCSAIQPAGERIDRYIPSQWHLYVSECKEHDSNSNSDPRFQAAIHYTTTYTQWA